MSEKIDTALSIFVPNQLSGAKCVFSERGLIIPDGVEFGTVEKLLGSMKIMSDSVQFWIGDALVYAERNYGEKYSQLLEATDYEYQSLKDMVWVASSISPDIRMKELTWSHHREVAKLNHEKQKEMLELAAKSNLTVSELRAIINHRTKDDNKPKKAEVYEAALKFILKEIQNVDGFDNEAFKNRCLANKVNTVTAIAITANDALEGFK